LEQRAAFYTVTKTHQYESRQWSMDVQVSYGYEVLWSRTRGGCQAWRPSSNFWLISTPLTKIKPISQVWQSSWPKQSKETYMKFGIGTPENAIRHIMTFHNLTLKLECKENYEWYKQLLQDIKAKITALGTIDATADNLILKEEESLRMRSTLRIARCLKL